MTLLFSRRAGSPWFFGKAAPARQAGSPAKRWAACALLALGMVLAGAQIALATASPEDISKSFENSFDQKTDPRWMIFGLAAAAGLLMVLALLGMRNQRGAVPKPLNHQGKLLREIRRQVAIKSSEVKQLKLMVEHVKTPDGQPLISPITLLLCPSLLVKSAPNKPGSRINRRVLGGLVRKLQGEKSKA